MSSTKKILIFGIILVSLFFLILINFCVPKIKIELNGQKVTEVEIGSDYKELGVHAYLETFLKNDPLDFKITGKVNTNKLGKYKIIYEAKSGNQSKKIERIINVVDSEKPIIKLNEPVKMCKNNKLVEINATANDNYDGDITNQIKYKVDNEKAYISVVDSSNNKTELVENVQYIDGEKPEIKLLGEKHIVLFVGQKYEEMGVTAYDSCDGDLTEEVQIVSDLDVTKEGSYTIFYSVFDSEGTVVSVTRNITVIDWKFNQDYPITPVKNGIIYLTFDDGPGQYTKSILDILNKYAVKATFFVTNQFPSYQHLIKEEYQNGHAVGLHTYSHKWSIYSSVDSYLEDFEKMATIIMAETGKNSKIFRFPGGSSNTVSRNYRKGIMSELAKLMTEKGYVYFDWTFDSGDTHLKNNTKDDILKNVKNYLKGDGEYIVLMHDIKKSTLEALPEVIEYGLSLGYRFAVLDENVNPQHFKIAN